jgi:trehalose 6-phosphate synthase
MLWFIQHYLCTRGWRPIDLRLRDDLEDAVANYNHYDVMIINAMFDGRNLVPRGSARSSTSAMASRSSARTRGVHEELL